MNKIKKLQALEKAVADLQLKLVEKESVILKKETALSEKHSIIESLNYQIHLFRTAKFGRKSEKVDDTQMRLFDEAIDEKIKKYVEADETITYTQNPSFCRKSI